MANEHNLNFWMILKKSSKGPIAILFTYLVVIVLYVQGYDVVNILILFGLLTCCDNIVNSFCFGFYNNLAMQYKALIDTAIDNNKSSE